MKLGWKALMLAWLLAACSSPAAPTPTTAAEIATAPATQAQPSATPVAALQATLAPLPAQLSVGTASCRMGPGGAYLLVTVLREGDAVNILGQMELNENWVLVATNERPAGCWINTSSLEFEETELNVIDDAHRVMAFTSYYSPLRNVTATRNGDVVRVRWDPLVVRAGDDALQTDYVVEAWVCQNGAFVFRAVGTNEYGLQIRDEQGCDEESHAQAAGVEINGYTQWIAIPWPER